MPGLYAYLLALTAFLLQWKSWVAITVAYRANVLNPLNDLLKGKLFYLNLITLSNTTESIENDLMHMALVYRRA